MGQFPPIGWVKSHTATDEIGQPRRDRYDRHARKFVERDLHELIMAYLVKPVKTSHLEPAIALAMQRFREFQAIQNQSEDLRKALEDRKLIERAKGVLTKCTDLNEQDTFRRLQKLASDKNQTLVEIARTIVTGDEALSE